VAHLHPVDQDGARRALADRLRQVGGVTVVRAIRDVITAYLARAKARSVTIRRGDVSVELTAQSPADQAELLDRLVDGGAGGR
jgi:hypothetical protein